MAEKFDSNKQANQAMQLAFGRILRIGSRPSQDGDVQQYEQAKRVFFDAAEFLGIDSIVRHSNFKPGWNFGNSVLD